MLPLQNELGTLEFIHHIIETFDRYFENVVGEVCAFPQAVVLSLA